MTPVIASQVARRSSLSGLIAKGCSLTAAGVIGSLLASAPALASGSISCSINRGPGNACDLTPGSIFGQLGDKQVVFQGFTINNPGNTAVDVVYNWLSFGTDTYADDIWTFAVTAAPSIGGPLELSYTYDVNILDDPTPGAPSSAPWFFDTVALESDVVTRNTPGVRVTKITNPENVELVSINGVPDGDRDYTFVGNYKTIRITDEVEIGAQNDVLTSVTNSWTQRTETVPGPLPIPRCWCCLRLQSPSASPYRQAQHHLSWKRTLLPHRPFPYRGGFFMLSRVATSCAVQHWRCLAGCGNLKPPFRRSAALFRLVSGRLHPGLPAIPQAGSAEGGAVQSRPILFQPWKTSLSLWLFGRCHVSRGNCLYRTI